MRKIKVPLFVSLKKLADCEQSREGRIVKNAKESLVAQFHFTQRILLPQDWPAHPFFNEVPAAAEVAPASNGAKGLNVK